MQIGDLCKVKDNVWVEWCLRHQKDYEPFKPQPLVQIYPVGGYVMLAFPFYWWKPEELEVVVERGN